MVVIDTSIIIDHTRQKNKISVFDKFSKKSEERLAIAVVTIQELFEGKSTKKEEVTNSLLDLIDSLEILPYTIEVAKLAGEIARDLDHPIDLADAAIAATTIINGGQLLTLNKKDFQNIKGLELV